MVTENFASKSLKAILESSNDIFNNPDVIPTTNNLKDIMLSSEEKTLKKELFDGKNRVNIVKDFLFLYDKSNMIT